MEIVQSNVMNAIVGLLVIKNTVEKVSDRYSNYFHVYITEITTKNQVLIHFLRKLPEFYLRAADIIVSEQKKCKQNNMLC